MGVKITLEEFILSQTNNFDTTFKDDQFDFGKNVVTLSGRIHEDWDYSGGYMEAPCYTFVSRDSDMSKVTISFEDGSVKEFTNEELIELDEKIEKL